MEIGGRGQDPVSTTRRRWNPNNTPRPDATSTERILRTHRLDNDKLQRYRPVYLFFVPQDTTKKIRPHRPEFETVRDDPNHRI